MIPTLLFVVAWIFVKLNPNIDLALGANYGKSVLVNLLIPLAILGIAQIIYALVLMIDCTYREKQTERCLFVSAYCRDVSVAYIYIYGFVRLLFQRTNKQ